MEDQEGKKSNWKEFNRMLGPSFRGTLPFYVSSLGLILLAAAAQTAEPVIYGRIVDAVISVAKLDTQNILVDLLPLVGLWAVAALVGAFAKELSQNLSWQGAYKVLQDFSLRSFANVLDWDPERFGRVSLGSLSKRIDKAWDATWTLSARMLTDVVPALVAFLAFLVVGLYLDWRMALVTLLGVPVLASLTLLRIATLSLARMN